MNLLTLWQQCRELLIELTVWEQAKRRERGAFSRADLRPEVEALEQRLLQSYDALESAVIASWRGSSDDVSSTRLAQAQAVPDAEALDFYGIDEEEGKRRLDPTRLAAILALLALWRSRHIAIADAAAGALFQRGRAKALAEIALAGAPPAADTSALRQQLLDRYRADIDRLTEALRSGSPRAHGLQDMARAPDLGTAAVLLRKLFVSERYRIGMFAESLVWTAWLEGHRAGAVDGTRHLASQKLDTDGREVDLAELIHRRPEIALALPAYEWTGPYDEKACGPCLGRFGQPVIAWTPADLPAPPTICQFGQACRHYWRLVGI